MIPLPRVIFVNRFYWPEEPATAQLLGDLAEELARRGHEVCVIASTPQGLDTAAAEFRHGVAIRRVRTPRLPGRHALAKAFNWLAFGGGALWRIGRDLKTDDCLVVLTDPPLLALAAVPLARWRGARVFHWVQDIYPELAILLGRTRGLGWLQAWRNRVWRHADACVTLGSDMARVLQTAGVKPARIRLSPNWAPHGLQPAPPLEITGLKHRWGLEGKFVVMYSGNLGRVHDIAPVITLAGALRHEPAIVFVFIGDGAQRAQLEHRVQADALGNVRFLPHQPRAQLAASLGVGDIHLVTLHPGCEALVFPSKFYGITAVGRPVLFIGPPQSELARQIESAGLGRSFSRDAVPAMAQTLVSWHEDPSTVAAMGRRALGFAHAAPGLGGAATTWQSLLASSGSGSSLARNT
jgi:colanic acid biosynthesis glycosyl transferase WcaI